MVGWRRHAFGPRVRTCCVRAHSRRCFPAGRVTVAPLSRLANHRRPRDGGDCGQPPPSALLPSSQEDNSAPESAPLP